MWVIYPLWVRHSLLSGIIVRFLRSDGEQRILWHVKRAVSICAEIQITMQVSPFKQWWKCHLQVHEIFSTVNAVFSEFKQILYRCKILPEPTGTNSCVVISHLSLIMLLINTITSPTYRNDRRTLFLKMPEDKFFSLFSSRVLLQENISKYRFSWSFKMIKDLNVSKY